MEIQRQLAGEFADHLAPILDAARVPTAVRQDLISQLSMKATEAKISSKKELVTVAKLKGERPEVIFYKPVIAAGIAAALLAGISTAPNPVVLGLIVVSCATALKGTRHAVSPAEGLLFWEVYSCDGRHTNREQAMDLFSEKCKKYEGIEPGDFAAALQGLINTGCLQEHDGVLQVKDKVVLLNTPPIYER